jgi:hypothetical protein
MGWSLSQAQGEGAKLAYGEPQSDNVLLMMTCQPRSGRVLISAPATSSEIELVSGRERSRLTGQAAPAMGDAILIEAQATPDDRALASFARTGDLALVADGRRASLPARSAEQRAIAGFFGACRA